MEVILEYETNYIDSIKAKALKKKTFENLATVCSFLGCMLGFYIATGIPFHKIAPEFECEADGIFQTCSQNKYCFTEDSKRRFSVSTVNWTSQYGLICDHRTGMDAIIAAYFIGSFLYNIVFGFIQDKFGRTRSMLFSTASMLFLMILALFANSFYQIVIFVFLLQFVNGLRVIFLIYLKEVMSDEGYNIAVGLGNSSFPVVALLQIVLISLTGNWIIVHWIMIISLVLTLIMLITVCPESPDFLLNVNDPAGARRSIVHISIINGTFDDIADDLNGFDSKIEMVSLSKINNILLKDIFSVVWRCRKIRNQFILNSFLLGYVRLICNGIMMTVDGLSDNIFWVTFAMVVSDFLGCSLSGPIMNKMSGRTTMLGGFLILALLFLGTWVFIGTQYVVVCPTLLLFVICVIITPTFAYCLSSIDKQYSSTLFNYSFAFSQLIGTLTPLLLDNPHKYIYHSFLCVFLFFYMRNKL